MNCGLSLPPVFFSVVACIRMGVGGGSTFVKLVRWVSSAG